jgi:hypothetical protein
MHAMKPGDAIATVAQPIAHGIDTLFGTDIAGCTSCQERKDLLNQGEYIRAFYTFFKSKSKGTKMEYIITLRVEAEDAVDALKKKDGAKTISVAPAPVVRPVTSIQPAVQNPRVMPTTMAR